MEQTKQKKPAANKSVAVRVRKAQLATSNALKNKKIAEALAVFGYTKAKIEAGKKLANAVADLDTKKKALQGKQYGASQALKKAAKKSDRPYKTTLEVARVAFRGNNSARTALVLGGKRKISIAGKLDQAQKLYENILNNESYLNKMKEYGYNKAKLKAEYALFKEVAKQDDAQESAKSGSQKATEQRNVKLKKMDRWMSDFRRIAKPALASNRQALEALGILAR